jgi:hypothetical protein
MVLGVTIGLLLAGTAAQQAYAQSVERTKTQFEGALRQLEREYADSVKTYRDKYVKSLDGLETQFTDAGKLEPVLALRAERDRFKAENAASPSLRNAPKDLAHLQTRFIEVLKGARKKHADRALALLTQYLKKLEELQTELVRKKRIDDALAVKQEADQARFIQAEYEAKAAETGIPALPALFTPRKTTGGATPRTFPREDRPSSVHRPAAPPVTPRPERVSPRETPSDPDLIVIEPTGWTKLFESADPAVWNTESNAEGNWAVPSSEAPRDMLFLRVTRVDSGEAVIMALTRDDLLKSGEQFSRYGWQGDLNLAYGGRHLGIYDKSKPLNMHMPDEELISVYKPYSDLSGWGFGHRAYRDDVQGQAWAGQEIGKTALRIDVTPGPLSAAEQGLLLKQE